jgi:hypothetical protein
VGCVAYRRYVFGCRNEGASRLFRQRKQADDVIGNALIAWGQLRERRRYRHPSSRRKDFRAHLAGRRHAPQLHIPSTVRISG